MTEETPLEKLRRLRAPAEPPQRPAGDVVVPLNPERSGKYGMSGLEGECAKVRAAPEGERNHTLNAAAFAVGQLIAGGHLEEGVARSHLEAAAAAVGLTATETAKTIGSGFRSGAKQPRVVAARPIGDVVDVHALAGGGPGTPQGAQDDPRGPDAAPAVQPPSAEEMDAFWGSREILSHLFTFARARRVGPWAVLGTALARIVVATPPVVHLPPIVGGRGSLNLFVGIVGRSGSGKGAAESVAADAIQLGHIDTQTTGSGEGIAHAFMIRGRGTAPPEWRTESHAVLLSVPEIDTLTAQADRKGATLLPELRRAWSGERLGFGYADPAKRLPVPAHEYRLALVAGIQPARAGALLDDSDGGTPQRFLWLPAGDRGAPDTAPNEPIPMDWSPPPLDHTRGLRMDVCQLARDTIDQARLDRLRGVGEALDGHALLARLKVAAALGIADGRYSVSEEDWGLADVIQRASDAVRAAVVDELKRKAKEVNEGKAQAEASRAVLVAERTEEAALKRVVRVVHRKLNTAEGPVTRRDLRNHVAGRDRGYFDAALATLLETGQIKASEHPEKPRSEAWEIVQ